MNQQLRLLGCFGMGVMVVAGCGPGVDVSKLPKATPTPEVADSHTSNLDGQKQKSSELQEPAGGSPPSSENAPGAATATELPVDVPDFPVIGPEGAVRISFDDLDLKKVAPQARLKEPTAGQLPQWLSNLDGKRIRIRAFMLPPFEDKDLKGFTLARDIQVMGPRPYPLSSLCDVTLRDGITTDYIENKPFELVGVLHIGQEFKPGELYRIDDAIIIRKMPEAQTR